MLWLRGTPKITNFGRIVEKHVYYGHFGQFIRTRKNLTKSCVIYSLKLKSSRDLRMLVRFLLFFTAEKWGVKKSVELWTSLDTQFTGPRPPLRHPSDFYGVLGPNKRSSQVFERIHVSMSRMRQQKTCKVIKSMFFVQQPTISTFFA